MKKLIIIFLMISFNSLSQDKIFQLHGLIFNNPDNTEIIIHKAKGNYNWEITKNIQLQEPFYYLRLIPETQYMVIFKKKDLKKILYINLDDKEGDYRMHINFNFDTHGIIFYNDKEEKYLSYLINNKNLKDITNVPLE